MGAATRHSKGVNILMKKSNRVQWKGKRSEWNGKPGWVKAPSRRTRKKYGVDDLTPVNAMLTLMLWDVLDRSGGYPQRSGPSKS